MTEDAMREIFAEVPAYETSLAPAFVADVREHVREHYLAALETLERGHAVTPEDLMFVRKHAAQRVGQVSVADFIHAFQVGQHVLLDAAIGLATDDSSRRAVLSLVGLIPRYFDVAISHAAEVYLEAEELLASTGERLRRDLLEDLLGGTPPPPGARLDAARAAGLDQRAGCLVIAALPTKPLEDPHALRAAANALARTTQLPAPPLAVVRHDEIVVVAPRPAGDVRGLAARLADTQERLAAREVPLAIGLSTVYDGLAALSDAYREAVSARDRLLPSPGVVALPAMTMFDYLTMQGDRTARRMVPPAIERFVAEDLGSGGALLDTLRAYAGADLNAKRAAEQLHIHVNTAHYRLARIAERTGCDLRRIGDVIELLIATRLAGAPGPVE
jgi:sugar diacid utilization regulator